MFAIAARYKTEPEVPLPLNEGDMWNAGDEYLEDAKKILSWLFVRSITVLMFIKFQIKHMPYPAHQRARPCYFLVIVRLV